MSELCNWSEDRLATRHPRYAKIFRRQTESDREEQEAGHRRRQGEQYEDGHGDDVGEDDGEISAVAASIPGKARKLVSPPPRLPAPPQPSADKALHAVDAEEVTKEEAQRSGEVASSEHGDVDVWAMKPVEAVNMLCAYVELLIREASLKPHKPPSPPVSSGSSNQPSRNGTPASQSSSMPPVEVINPVETAGKEDEPPPTQEPHPPPAPPETTVTSDQSSPEEPYLQRVPRASRTPIDSPVSNPRTPIHSRPPSPRLPHIVVTETDKKFQTHHLAKRFFCKSIPNVSLAAYLGRIHKYCHMSTAVYLAAGMYIERLSQVGGGTHPSGMSPPTPISTVLGDEDVPIVELAPKSVHRLLLAAIRVANKALSDLYWPHKRVAEVGGVSQLELQRLEVSMCYLCDFKLQVNLGDLESWVRRARSMGVIDTSASTG